MRKIVAELFRSLDGVMKASLQSVVRNDSRGCAGQCEPGAGELSVAVEVLQDELDATRQ